VAAEEALDNLEEIGTSTTAKAAMAYKAVSTALIFIMLVVVALGDTKVQLQAMEA
jgi:hypothetical protein